MTTSAGVACDSVHSSRPNGDPNVLNWDNGKDATKDYSKYPETIDLLSSHGFAAARMSVSWTRLMTYQQQETTSSSRTTRRPVASVNQAGVNHYKKVFAAYRQKGLDIALTMWHWDTPQALENYAMNNLECMVEGTTTGSAWLCPDISDYFEEYAELLLKEFGPYVKYWMTLNEPLTVVSNGYASPGKHAPGRCSDRTECTDGNDRVEPFVAADNLIKSHAKAFRAWKKSADVLKDSVCGIVLNGDFTFPYKEGLPAGVGDALPKLDVQLVQGTHGGIYFQNHYTSCYAKAITPSDNTLGYTSTANYTTTGYSMTGEPIGLPSSNGWLFAYPPGLALTQSWITKRYPGVSIVVTENGWGNDTTTKEQDVLDLVRCNYYRSYIGNMSYNAHHNGIKVLGFFAWSILDNFEWADGYSTRFGLTYVDFKTQERTPKLSLRWFSDVIRKFGSLPVIGQEALPKCEEYVFGTTPTGDPEEGEKSTTLTDGPEEGTMGIVAKEGKAGKGSKEAKGGKIQEDGGKGGNNDNGKKEKSKAWKRLSARELLSL
eukprot:gb/GEZN01004295.1/.p1 GENE.gb/GEZN01004295.1/~~gb/GEZN01004295.1/.p1  ORF type:complete len:624 (+),score=62.05 gb/GEZN01004295.1/:243-1874(+)